MTLALKLIGLMAFVATAAIIESSTGTALFGQDAKPVLKAWVWPRYSGLGTLEDTTRSSDAVLRGHVLTNTVEKVREGHIPELRTIQTAKVLEVLRATNAVTNGDVITIVRAGGEYDDADRRIVILNSVDPSLTANGEYVVWLSWHPARAAFRTTNGLNCVFQVVDGKLKRLSETTMALQLDNWTVSQVKSALEQIR